MDTLFNMKGPKKPLRAYIKRFQLEFLRTEGCDERTAAIAFKRGLPHTSKLHHLLTKTPTEDMTSILAKAEKHAKLEDESPPQGTAVIDALPDLRSRLVPTKEQNKGSPNKKRKVEDRSMRNLTPLNTPIQVIL